MSSALLSEDHLLVAADRPETAEDLGEGAEQPDADLPVEAQRLDDRLDEPPEAAGEGASADDQAAEGVTIAAEQLRAVAAMPGVSGVTLVTPGDPGLIPAAVRASGLRP